MKIGILTFHDGINHGAFLQAFSLCRYFQELGHDCQIINYRNRTHAWQEYMGYVIRLNPVNICRYVRKIFVFRKALQRSRLTPFTMDANTVAALDLDVVVTGSDLIWNFQWSALGGDRIYFGGGLDRFQRVSYAPSFGSIPADVVLPEDIHGLLKRYTAISVRDGNAAEIIQRNLGQIPALVLDPIFLLDMEALAEPIELPSRFMLVYAFRLTREEKETARRYAELHGLEIVALGYHQYWCDRQKIAVDPFQWISAFYRAECVVTSTFHGAMFALAAGQKFYVSHNPEIYNKTIWLLEQIGQSNRMMGGVEHMDALLSTPLPAAAKQGLETLREQSRSFIDSAMRLCEQRAGEEHDKTS
jgi:hypothetical protein